MPIRDVGPADWGVPARGGVRMMLSIVSAGGAALVGVVAAVSHAARSGFVRGRGGFNCCERCSTPLPRDQQHTWRYSGTCARCGYVQEWASTART